MQPNRPLRSNISDRRVVSNSQIHEYDLFSSIVYWRYCSGVPSSPSPTCTDACESLSVKENLNSPCLQLYKSPNGLLSGKRPLKVLLSAADFLFFSQVTKTETSRVLSLIMNSYLNYGCLFVFILPSLLPKGNSSISLSWWNPISIVCTHQQDTRYCMAILSNQDKICLLKNIFEICSWH